MTAPLRPTGQWKQSHRADTAKLRRFVGIQRVTFECRRAADAIASTAVAASSRRRDSRYDLGLRLCNGYIW